MASFAEIFGFGEIVKALNDLGDTMDSFDPVGDLFSSLLNNDTTDATEEPSSEAVEKAEAAVDIGGIKIKLGQKTAKEQVSGASRLLMYDDDIFNLRGANTIVNKMLSGQPVTGKDFLK